MFIVQCHGRKFCAVKLRLPHGFHIFGNMKTKLILLSALMILSFVSFGQKKEKDKILAKKTFNVTFLESGKKDKEKKEDKIVFINGNISSTFIQGEEQFNPFPYTVTVDSSSAPIITVSFTADGKNPDGNTIKWEGSVTDDTIEGKAVISNKKGKVVREYNYSGTLKEKPGTKK